MFQEALFAHLILQIIRATMLRLRGNFPEPRCIHSKLESSSESSSSAEIVIRRSATIHSIRLTPGPYGPIREHRWVEDWHQAPGEHHSRVVRCPLCPVGPMGSVAASARSRPEREARSRPIVGGVAVVWEPPPLLVTARSVFLRAELLPLLVSTGVRL